MKLHEYGRAAIVRHTADARTATTAAGVLNRAMFSAPGKSVPKIAVAHNIPYVATATVADLHDLERKVIKAISIHGARYIQIQRALPARWGPLHMTPSGWRSLRSNAVSIRSSRPSTARSRRYARSAARFRYRTI